MPIVLTLLEAEMVLGSRMSNRLAGSHARALTLDNLHAEIAALRDEVAKLRTLLVREPPMTWETTAEAAARVGRSEQTIRTWCRRFRIGIQVNAAWRVDRDLLDKLLADWSGASA